MSRAHDLAWAAGFFDGEGYVTISRRKHKLHNKIYTGFYLRAGINHVAPEPVKEMLRIFGGKLEYTDRVIGNRKPRYRWVVNTATAANTLKQLLPYLRNKNKAVELGLEFQKTIQDTKIKVSTELTQKREELKQALQLLNSQD